MRTRSGKAREPENGHDASEEAPPPVAEDDAEINIEVHLSRALHGVRSMRQELADLRKRNAELEQRLEAVEQAEDASIQPRRGRKGGPTVAKLQGEVRRLTNQLQMLEKAKRKDRKTIAKLRAREVKEDVAELEDDTEILVGDSPYRMRKLLRRFHDIVLSVSIEESEECPICMDTLQVNKCVSLPCEHTFCKSCISQVAPGEDAITCPQCRSVCPRDEIEIVQYTASQQWDDLLDVAKAWAKMDLRRQADTSEEEVEEEFIDDHPPDDDASSVHTPSENPLATSPEPDNDIPGDAGPSGTSQLASRDPQTTPRSKRRKIAFTPESSPLSQLYSAEPPQDPGPSATALQADVKEESIFPTSNPEVPVAGSSNSAERAEQTPDGTQNDQNTPTYAQSPVKDKRKRLEELATARKQKRRL